MQVEALALVEAGQKELLERLFRGRCRDPKDPLWYHTLRAYWDRDTDECIVKQVASAACAAVSRQIPMSRRSHGVCQQSSLAMAWRCILALS